MERVALFLTAVLLVFWASNAATIDKPACGRTGGSKRVQLESPAKPPSQCVYYIKAYNSKICQLRLDFAWTLAQPKLDAKKNNSIVCSDDYFGVHDLKLCGVETEQHIHVPFNTSGGLTVLDLRIELALRTSGTVLPKASWNILVTQLECANGAAKQYYETGLEQSSSPSTRAATNEDGYWLAPPGCLQYFPNPRGSVTSFNLNNGKGIYPSNLQYAICFRRTTLTKSLSIKLMYFQVGAQQNLGINNIDEACYHRQINSLGNSDYLMVPLAHVLERNQRITYFCGNSVHNNSIISTSTGPLYVLFNSADQVKRDSAGFAFSYVVG